MNIHGLPSHLDRPADSRLGLVDSVATRTVPQQRDLKEADQVLLSKLKARDQQVKQHEQAHLSAAAGLNVSSASFTYQRGPNGVNYAVGGDVRIDTSPARNPADTLAKAEQIIDAALAPADPSATDRAVAARAQLMAQQARAELQLAASAAKTEVKSHPHPAVQAYEDGNQTSSKINTFA